MRNDIVDILLEIGIPAGVKGFTYIYDALELFDTDTYYSNGKICSLYADIAKKRGTTASSVKRAIRHAFETATTKGNREVVEQYLDLVNTQNSNLLRTLYLRLKQKEKRHHIPENGCTMQNCIYKQQIYQEAVDKVSAEMSSYLFKLIESTRKNPETVDQLLGLY